jgi:hypothetical protein
VTLWRRRVRIEVKINPHADADACIYLHTYL